MQHSNYNETNGIVVGPEISRIFAEVIFQEIDRRIIAKLAPRAFDVDFSIKRYVDDYFIYANSIEDLTVITRCIAEELEAFKLFINHQKTATITRPFVSPLTLARSELAAIISALQACVESDVVESGVEALKSRVKDVKRLSLNIRLISHRYEVNFSSISGWLLSTLRSLLERLVRSITNQLSEDIISALTDMAVAILEISLHIVALDLRVRSTYSLCQIAAVIDHISVAGARDSHDRLHHILSEEILNLIRAQDVFSKKENSVSDGRDSVELYNLLIMGAHYVGTLFANSKIVISQLDKIADMSPVTYFGYIVCKFCWLKDRLRFDLQQWRLMVGHQITAL